MAHFIVEIPCRSDNIWRDVWVIRRQGGEPKQGHLLSSQDSKTRAHLGPHARSPWTGRLTRERGGGRDYDAHLLRAWSVELGMWE